SRRQAHSGLSQVAARRKCCASTRVTPGVCLGVRFTALDKANQTSLSCVRGALLGPISGEEQRRGVLCGGLPPRRGGKRRRFLGQNRCNRSSGWVTSSAGVAAEVPEGVHPGKMG